MKRNRHTPEQIITKLREAEAMMGVGNTIGQTGAIDRPYTAGVISIEGKKWL